MRASEVRAAIVTAIEAITPDGQAGGRDALKHVDMQGREVHGAPDRLFRVAMARIPRRADLATMDAFISEHTIEVFYTAAPGVDDRVAGDCERIVDALLTLHSTASDIMRVDIEPGSVAEDDSLVVARIDVATLYRLTGV